MAQPHDRYMMMMMHEFAEDNHENHSLFTALHWNQRTSALISVANIQPNVSAAAADDDDKY